MENESGMRLREITTHELRDGDHVISRDMCERDGVKAIRRSHIILRRTE